MAPDFAVRDRGDVLECEYAFSRNPNAVKKEDKHEQKGWVILAHPPVKTVAQWIGDACVKRAAGKVEGCVTTLQKYVEGQSGAQFPVLGFRRRGAR